MAKQRIPTPDLEPTVKAQNDAYTGMLAISLIALITGCVLLFLDYSQYHPDRSPPKVSKVLPTATEPPPAEPKPEEPPNQPPPKQGGGN